jgi:anaerobic magnesium-protoporphyrin IX monomethyl ester cyclase
MARVFLLNPPTDEMVRSPLLSFAYLAASLRRAGHEVALLDASAPFAPHGADQLAERALAFRPDLIGIHCKTLYVQDAYALAAAFAARGCEVPLVCGGPHPTVVPLEPLAHGFHFAIRGEGEETLVELADALDGKRDFSSVRSLAYRGPAGEWQLNPSRGFQLDLDALASPLDALDLFDPAWYGADARVAVAAPSGLLSSRGCPAACTFCSNNVTGRRFRYRSAALIAAEIDALYDRTGMTAFSFFDDSFAVGRRRVEELCEALSATRAAKNGLRWTCTAHPAHLDREILKSMQQAGCGGVDIGMESGDPEMLLRIGKGVTVERVLQVLQDARSLGLHCMLNIMFGWPDETLDELRTTIAFLERAAPLAAAFNARGVLVPYPGTEMYDRHHARYGFTDWWLREPPLRYLPFPSSWSRAEIERAYAADAALPRNFFRLPQESLDLIQQGLARKASFTLEKAVPRRPPPAIPAAGAR